MSNSRTLQLHQTLNLNKLYSYSNSNSNYLIYNFNLRTAQYLITTGNYGFVAHSYFSEHVLFFKILFQMTQNHVVPFLFHKQNKHISQKYISVNQLRTSFKKSISTKTLHYKNNTFTYTYNPFFSVYKTLFNNSYVPLFSPFIKKKARTFTFISKTFTKKLLKTQRLKKKIFAHRKFWFLYTITRLNKKIKIFNINKKFNFRKFLKTLRLKRKQLLKRKNYLTPRQHLFLNGTRLTLKGKKSIKVTLLHRMVRFYRRKLRRINITNFNSKLTNKSLKYKLKLIKSKKRFYQFVPSSLTDLKFFPIQLNMQRIIRRGKSRLKLRRTKKYYLNFLQTLRLHLNKLFVQPLLRHYSLSRVRYLNRFFRQNIRRYKVSFFTQFSSLRINTKNTLLLANNNELLTSSPLSTNYYICLPVIQFVKELYSPVIKNLTNQLFHKVNRLQTIISPLMGLTNTQKPISIISKYKAPFILSTIGFVFIQNICTQTNSYIKSKFNRFRYSFFFKKDLKRYLLKKPGKLKLVSSSTLFKNYKTKYSRFGKPFVTSYFSNKLVELSGLSPSTSSNSILTSQNPFFSYKNARKYNNYLGTFFKKEVRIKRIKFKPGYSRIWRSARESINSSLNFNLRYQYRLTRHLHRLQHLSKQTQAYIHDLTLKNTLLNARFVNDHNTSLMFVTNGLVFVNGVQTSNPNLNLFQNDFIQIIVSLKYYIIFRWLLNWNASKRIRLRKLSKTKFKKFKMMANKQRSRNLPDWILTSRLKSFDIPKYLEVDFFTLSAFILYEPFILNDLNSINFLESRSEILNMYNWKYIN